MKDYDYILIFQMEDMIGHLEQDLTLAEVQVNDIIKDVMAKKKVSQFCCIFQNDPLQNLMHIQRTVPMMKLLY